MRRCGFVLGLVSLIAVQGHAQDPSAGSVTYRADTTLVLVPVGVTDASNRFVLGLEPENFTLFEDGKQQTIKHLSNEEAPLSIGLVLDTSGSMGSKLDTSRQAAKEFLKALNPSDEAFLVEFSDVAQLTIPFTQDAGKIGRRLDQEGSAGLTALLDGVHVGLQEMKNAKNPRKALVVISDGGDNNSRYKSSEIESLVREADVQVYALGVFEPYLFFGLTSAEVGGPKLLSEIAEQTGGRALAASSEKDLPRIAARIGLELRNQYVLAYSPSNQNRDGKYHRIEVKLHAPDSLPALKARWRAGYYAPSE